MKMKKLMKYVVYAKFINVLRQVPTIVKLLPIETPTAEQTEGQHLIDYIYEPSAEEILLTLLPRYVGSLIYNAMLEAKPVSMVPG